MDHHLASGGSLIYRSLAAPLLISFLFLAAFAEPALGISISYAAGEGSSTVSSSESFNLDDATALREETMLDFNRLYQVRQAEGTGRNSIKQQLDGNDYSVETSIDSAGAFSVATSAAASSEGTDMSQQVAGTGEMSTSIQGTQGDDSAGQEASVMGGVLSSSQSLSTSAGDGVSAAQATKMAGIVGRVSSGAISSDKAVLASGSFLGAGTLEATISAQAEAEGTMLSQASMAVDGAEWLTQSDLDEASQEGVGVAVEGLRLDRMGDVGSFAMQAASMGRADYEIDKSERSVSSSVRSEEDGTGSTVLYLNNPNAYVLAGWRWNTKDPQIRMYLKRDANFNNEGLDAEATKRAIEAAANTWDDAVAQNLFADNNLVTVTEDPNVKTDTRDGYNVHAWKPITEGLAYSRTRYYTTKVNGYYSAFESDIVYDSDYQWATDGQDYDVQSVALHELGHTIGLGDLYGKPEYAGDTDQIMHYYDAPQHMLGVGDKTGIQALYGYSNLKDGIGIYRSSYWFLDYNSDGGVDKSINYGGQLGDIPISGDWDGDGTSGIGIYRLGYWILDYNNDGSTDKSINYGGQLGDIPISGDWDGDGTSGIGIYRSGYWALDYNDDGVADKFIGYGGMPGDIPVSGDWNGDGKYEICIYRSGYWIFDYNNDGVVDKFTGYGGLSSDVPVSGDWNGDGTSGIGIYRSGYWIFDYNSDGVADKFIGYGGLPGDVPVSGDW